jgi:hypothetical protein
LYKRIWFTSLYRKPNSIPKAEGLHRLGENPFLLFAPKPKCIGRAKKIAAERGTAVAQGYISLKPILKKTRKNLLFLNK